jgi:hypothetical protein
MSDQYNPLEIRYIPSTKGYSYDNEVYHKNFPEEWATSHKPGTGPKECANCAFFGSFGGHFFAYCVNCAVYEYSLERGPGMFDDYTEFATNDVPSVFDTYMKNISIEDIGDRDMNTDDVNDDIPAMLERRRVLQEQIHNGWNPLNDRDGEDDNDDEHYECYHEYH